MKRTSRRWGLLSALLLVWTAPVLAQPASAPTSQPSEAGATGAIDQTAWATILSTYVGADGRVSYSTLRENGEHMALLDGYIASLATATPDAWSREEQFAFWLNAYNALVMNAVLDSWPTDSVMSIDGFFDGAQYRVAGESLTLNHIERDKMTAGFRDVRMHFALNCAAVSCPPLRGEPYVGARLEEQLVEQTTNFVRASTRLDPDNRAIYVSKIFEWFTRDFQPVGGHRAFISRYIRESDLGTVRATVNFFHFDDYDWAINGQ